jgi:FlaA1/EpsC-like NDP-sugar epimerase
MTCPRVPDRVSKHLVLMARPTKQALMLVADALLLAFAVWVAYVIRLGEWFVPNRSQVLLMIVAPLAGDAGFPKDGTLPFGHSLPRRAGLVVDTQRHVTGRTVVGRSGFHDPNDRPGRRPEGGAFPLLAARLRAGGRFAFRRALAAVVADPQPFFRQAGFDLRRGQRWPSTGRVSATRARPFPAGFLDDDRSLHGKDVGGLRVYPPEHLPTLLERFDIHDVIVTLPSASSARRREVVASLEHYAVRVRILPALTDIANGRHLVNMVREVDIGDLLGRDPVAADPTLLGRCITGKAVLVSGAGGSIGSELCRQIAALQPGSLILLDASEHALYQIHRILQSVLGCELVPCLGSVGDAALVSRLLVKHRIATVYHAAAYKHVPMVEANVLEGARNNVLGTLALANAAFDAGVETFVLISTDKAVRPTNIMGASKRWAELLVQGLARQAAARATGQRFCAVRFGNVLGSSGSVIPLFKEQIAQGGPVTVTDAEVTRYFMSIHEAVQLVIQTGSLASGGEIFLLDMGEPVRILDLARNMIRLAGYKVCDEATPEGDIEIILTGLRPGEKLYEELLIASSNGVGTSHPKIMKADEPSLDQETLDDLVEQLRTALKARNEATVRALVMHIAGDQQSGEGGANIAEV